MAFEPTAVEPTAVDPLAVKLTTVEPTAVNPTVVEASTVEPTAVDPAAAEPTVVDPTAVELTPVYTIVVEPTAVDLMAVEPTAVNATAVEPMAVNPAAAEVTTVNPTAVELTAVYHTAIDPAIAEPTVVDPTAVELTPVYSTVVEPTAVDLMAVEPTAVDHRIFLHLCDLTVVNAWLLYKRVHRANCSNEKVMRLHDFKYAVAEGLCYQGKNTASKKRSRRSEDSIPVPAKRTPTSAAPSLDVQKDQVGHFPKWTAKRQRCKLASCHKLSSVACRKCGVNLCFTSRNNCFLAIIVSLVLFANILQCLWN